MDPLGDIVWRSQLLHRPAGKSKSSAAEAPLPSDTFQAGSGPAPTGRPKLLESAPEPEPEAELPEFQLGSTRGSLATMKELRQRRTELKGDLKAAYHDPLDERAEIFSQFRDVDAAVKRMEVHRRNEHWQQIVAGADETPSKTYHSFFVNGQTPIEEMKEVVKAGQGLARGDSPMITHGNAVDPLTRHEIWARKMELLEDVAKNPTREGQPRSVDAEYYELASAPMLDKLSRAAKGGANVRVLMDPGHLQLEGGALDATSIGTRLGTISQLEAGSGGKAGVVFFANRENLGGRAEIMHRKQLRVDDTTVFGGMNANPGSGENIDFGMTIEGPASRELSKVFQDDLHRSVGRGVEGIYGDQVDLIRNDERDITLHSYGLRGLIEAQTPQPPKPRASREESVDRALDGATYAGLRPERWVELPEGTDLASYLKDGHGAVKLTAEGREVLASTIEKQVAGMNRPENQQRLLRNDLPAEQANGVDTVAVGDSPVERQALLLHAIDSAEKSIKVSAFVLNEDLARLLAEKKERMEAEGKPFEVQVVLDPGVYGYGGTPNEKGFQMLEDRGIPVKWAVLDRTDVEHDRKVHAKLMITDKMMLAGSTNFSHKGLRENWELSDVMFFNDSPESQVKQQEVVSDFDRLYHQESLGINTRALAEQRFADLPEGPARDLSIEKYRSRTLRRFLGGIDNYERQIGATIQDTVEADADLRYDVRRRIDAGESRGYATLQAVGPERLQTLRAQSPAFQRLLKMQEGDDKRQ